MSRFTTADEAETVTAHEVININISPHQLSYVTNSNAGEGLLFYGNIIIPFIDHFPEDTQLFRLLTTRPGDLAGKGGMEQIENRTD